LDWATLTAFRPDPARARYLDRRARERLASSLQEIFDACRGYVVWHDDDAAALLQHIRRQSVSPTLFGLYTDLVEAIFDDRLDEAQDLANLLLQPQSRNRIPRRILTLTDDDLGPTQADRYRRLLNDEPGLRIAVDRVEPDILVHSSALLMQTEKLLCRAAPEIAGEIAALVQEIVVVASCAAPEFSLQFDGASTFYLWGAIFLNLSQQQMRVAVAEALAHETGHCHLLGVTLGAPLVENDPLERHESPLRDDERPMDGIVHAAYVLARMVYCMERLAASGCLSGAETEAAKAAAARDRALYHRGLSVVDRHARFTPIGKAVFDEACAFMRAGSDRAA
jgi:HEXXH motif-containing protein